MAQCNHLPIYKTTYNLLLRLTQLTVKFEQNYKHTLGEKIRKDTLDLLALVYKANSSKTERTTYIQQFLDSLQVLEFQLRLSKDLRQLNVAQFAEIVEMSDSLGRQAQGWLKSSF